LCVERCPAQAIAGRDWEPGLAREHIYPLIAYRNQTNLTDVRFSSEKSR